MKHFFDQLQHHPLFAGIAENEFKALLGCVQGRLQAYSKHEILLLAGDRVEHIGLVLSGTVQILRVDQDGKQTLLTELHEGELFGEVFACAAVAHSPVTVSAAVASEVLLLNYRKVITSCPSSCAFHQRLIENMLTLLAQKTLMLNQKLELLSKRTTRARLLTFFEQYGGGRKQFTLPYNREELAASLCVERSALSAELSKMQRDGLIRSHRREIELLF